MYVNGCEFVLLLLPLLCISFVISIPTTTLLTPPPLTTTLVIAAVVVVKVVAGGIAANDGRLHPGDKILAVNDISVEGLTQQGCYTCILF